MNQNSRHVRTYRFFGAMLFQLLAPLNGAEPATNIDALAVVDRVGFFPAPNREQAMVGGTFSGSNTSSSEGFQLLADITEAPALGEWSEITLGNQTAYRWVRYEAPAGSRGNIAELEVYAGDRQLRGAGFGTPGFLKPGGPWKNVFDGHTE